MPARVHIFPSVFLILLPTLASCHRPRPEIPQLNFPAPAASSRTGGFRGVEMPAIKLPVDLRIDLNWLDLEGFFPPGAQRIGPDHSAGLKLLPDSRTRFPSTELAPSPNREFVLFVDGTKRTRQIHHWLMLLARGADIPNSIFTTTTAFDVTWSPDSSCFALTHFVGNNSSELILLRPDRARSELVVTSLIQEHFPAHFADVRLFLKAYRWTPDHHLVLRALGRSSVEPHDLLGLEALVDLSAFTAPRLKFLRGYIKPPEPPLTKNTAP